VPPALAAKAAAASPTPAEIDAALLRLIKVTVQQLGVASSIDADPAKGFAQAKEILAQLKQIATP